MAPDSWLIKVKIAISSGLDSFLSTMALVADNPPSAVIRRKTNVGILAFEIASLMSKLTHLWRSLSQAHVSRLRHELIALPGVRRIVSDDDAFLLRLASAELTESLRLVAESVSAMGRRCSLPGLRHLDRSFKEFAESGIDSHRWVMSWKEMESKAKKMDRHVTTTATLYKEMDELSEAENGLRKLLLHRAGSGVEKMPATAVSDVQQKVFWKKQNVKYLKETSLWGRSFEKVTWQLARSTFTVMARIKHVFGVGPHSFARSLSVSAAVYPSADSPNSSFPFTSGPLMPPSKERLGFFEENSAVLSPPSSTLGAAALALHYANLILVLEKMIRSPRSIGEDARDDLYAMLPASIRGALRSRLKGVGCDYTACDAGLAGEWRVAMERIMEWMVPMAYNTIRWQGERSFERRSAAAAAGAAPMATALLLQTLYFASREKAEAAIAELLVGLNYVWRFEIEASAQAAAALNSSSH